MKRTLCLLLSAIMALALVGCNETETNKSVSGASSKAAEPAKSLVDEEASASSDSAESNVSKKSEYGVTYYVPSAWIEQPSDSGTFYYPEQSVSSVNEIVFTSYSDISTSTPSETVTVLDAYADGMGEGDDVTGFEKESCTVAGVDARKLTYRLCVDEAEYDVVSYVFPVGRDGVFSMSFASSGKADIDYSLYYDLILDTIELPDVESDAESADSTDTNKATSTKEEEAQDDSLTTEQSSALQKADDYLSISAFSHDGLVDQLEYEGFSTEDATYAADNCGADWNEQAAKKAQDYRDMQAFSHKGLVDQLEYEGFTAEQAEYGASATE